MPYEREKLLKIIEVHSKYILLAHIKEYSSDCSFITCHKVITYTLPMTQGETLPTPWKSSCAHSLLTFVLPSPKGKFAYFQNTIFLPLVFHLHGITQYEFLSV